MNELDDPRRPDPRPLVLLRAAVAILLGIHGYYRLLSGGVGGFGGYLSSVGIPLGPVVAWAITGFEMTACFLLGAGLLVRFIAPGFALILLGGIALVHGREGWFVVGGGRNGVEYSVLLLVCLAVLFWIHPWPRRPRSLPAHAGPP